MQLKDLLKGLDVIKIAADIDIPITAIAYDSRKTTPGSLFVAITGYVTDGNQYISQALEKGAVAVVTAAEPKEEIPYVLVKSDRLALAVIAANYYGNPANAMKIIGITGTNGKTTSTLLLKRILETVTDAKVGLIGTTNNMIGDISIPSDRTTPESLDLQALLAKMRDAGCEYVVMEVSSHAIILERVAGVHFNVAAFTNLTEDHLDFHKTMENYCDAKAQLFARADRCVINRDDQWFSRISAKAGGQMMSTSVLGMADLWVEHWKLYADGVAFTAVYNGSKVDVILPIPGKFMIYNAVTALACALSLGISLEKAAAALASAKGVKGRVEVIPTPGKPYTVLIDYAHTPDGLKNVLLAVREFCKGKLIAVFGCGGDRDPQKRPIMGKIGTDLADMAVITSDNPRTERPMSIIGDILDGVESYKENYKVIENRVLAIRYAMDIAEKNDIIVLAGKGHETYQEIHGRKRHLDEREVVRQYLKETRE
ncbi:MAG: UDP-N-acetylmuramoyl-L-alanyl-D-glutamate--2,6-diaminopimelate ligase [Oscillospiraceae bacterium]|nr:UDP-N-acetylmuramoyl-L-alanyl-D-glutamate--2,6-diaminopimelate ligase [Oscillospiraceae bacterium]